MTPELQYFIKQLLNGLSVGSMYAMIAVGYSMVYSILYLINFAHGDLYIFGTFLALAFFNMGLPLVGAMLLGAILCGLIAMGIERAVYRPVRGANRIVPMVGALGAALILRTIAQVWWGASQIVYPTLIPSKQIPLFGGFEVNLQNIVILSIGSACVIGLTFLIKHTKLGKATQCVMQDITTSSLMGIPINVIIPLVYALGGFLGTIGGVLMSSYYTVINIEMGLWGTCKAWAASQLGGVGSFYGAFCGGLLLGIAESLAAAYISSAYKDAVGYVIIVVVLLFMPQGLFGKKKAEKL
jgi:Branched-chain amino acid ABC-type transport system, permease components